MSTKNQTKKSGFTIIEVVLVLAIAGLIFLMVFVALPALQKSQRDTQRRNDVARVGTAITQYLANNNKLPSNSDAPSFKNSYLGSDDDFKDPDGNSYRIKIAAYPASTPSVSAQNKYDTPAEDNDNYAIVIYTGAKCNGETAVSNTGGNSYAILYKLEGSGAYCVDNQ